MGTTALAKLAATRGDVVLSGTRDPDEVVDACTGALRPHALTLSRPGTRLATRLASVKMQDVSVNLLRYGAGVTVSSGDAPLDDYLLTLPIAGAGQFRYGSATALASVGHGVLIGPHQDFEFGFDEAWDQVVVRLDRSRVESVAAALTGETGPVHFDLSLAPDVSRLDGMLESAVDLVDSAAVQHRPQLLWQLEQVIIESLLLAQPNNRMRLQPSDRPMTSPRLRQAMEFMIDRIADPLSVADVALACGTSVRSLQTAFRTELGTTPVQWLRSQRLERAHTLLLSGAPGLSVTDVAYRCGFFHLGEFGVAFRARYGTTPSAVLTSRR
ncbi:AraC family transcriptional regulator [Nocardioides cavernaquae]|uniref:AraC family transcriptional regulator n=1 Tax=Nocardioides cavernaquae TaxID=2321396 RepID=A0A3A5H724_9ACTN|nr:AraC family transcriptional regulator [Nocardioides cavernaquae]RJS45781.1 AraC family transcriptional regulator [Nocardioides cavernaquae]